MKKTIHEIEQLLRKHLTVERLQIIDESEQHAGHAGVHNNESSLTHVWINIKTPDLKKYSKVDQHRYIYSLLQSELNNGLHALRLNIE